MRKTDEGHIDPQVVLESMTESILITDANLEDPGPVILYVNPSFERMTGWKKEEIIGKNPRILQGPKTEHAIFHDLKEKLLNGEVWSGRTINYRKDGSEFYMEWSITPIGKKGHPVQFLAVQRDVTRVVGTEKKLEQARVLEKKRLQEIEKANSDLNDLLSRQNQTLSLFTKYVPESIVKKALSSTNEENEVSLRLDVALLFCDIREFTRIIETLHPEKVVQLLNVYYSHMSETINEHQGVINQFVGDEIFVAFGAPEPISDPSISAVKCALAMIDKLTKINDQLKDVLQQEITVGIGIHYGSVVAGNLGSEDKLSYSITGSPVVTAKRIESLTRSLKNTILISQYVYALTLNLIETRPWGRVEIKGKNEKIAVYQVIGLNQPE